MPENKRYMGSGKELEDKSGFRHLSYKTLASIASGGAMALRMEIMAAHHPDVVPGVMSEETAEAFRSRSTGRVGSASNLQNPNSIFGRGKIVIHVPTHKKVTIIQASGDGRLQVIDKHGKKFLANKNNLKPIVR